MFEKISFHQYAANSLVYRFLRDYFNNPVKRKQIANGYIRIVDTDGSICVVALTSVDSQLYRVYSLFLRKLRAVYDDDDNSRLISSIDREFAPMVCAASPHFGWRL